MALSVVQPAAAVTEMIRARLGDIAERRACRTRGLAETAPQALQLSLPHPVFNLGFDDLASPAPLERATMTGWRYLVMEGTRVVAAVEAAARWRNDPATYSHTNEGAFVQSAARLLGQADGWPEMRSGQHVIGLLRVPSLYSWRCGCAMRKGGASATCSWCSIRRRRACVPCSGSAPRSSRWR